jgi:hypothetical protein
MNWKVVFDDDFAAEFDGLAEALQDELLAHAMLLREFGPNLGRPTVDTLKGSRHPNMKELRFGWAGEIWRVAFAFDPARQAILLVGGDKGGADQKRFYKRLIKLADERFERHLGRLVAAATGATKEKRHDKKP